MTITYDITFNNIKYVGDAGVKGDTETNPFTFEDAYQADKAGTLQLTTRNVTGVDASPVNLTRNLRPADEVVLGGPKNDLWITITGWNATSATVRIIGTDIAGNPLTEDINVSGDGTYYATGLFKTLTQSQVTALVGTGFTYEVVQGQWGVVSKLGTCYKFDCNQLVGLAGSPTWLINTSKQLILNGNYSLIFYVDSVLRFGRLRDATLKTTDQGCQIISLATSVDFGIFSNQGGWCQVYSTVIDSPNVRTRLVVSTSNFYMYNCILNRTKLLGNASATTSEIFNVIIVDASATTIDYGIAWRFGTVEKLWMYHNQQAIKIATQGPTTIKSVYARGNTYVAEGNSMNIEPTLINVDCENWAIRWTGTNFNKRMFRQYELDIFVEDKDGSPIEGVSVIGTYEGAMGPPGSSAFTATTDATGQIPTQTLSHGYFKYSTGSTEQLMALIKVVFTKAGYKTVVKYYPLNEKTKDRVVLQKAVDIIFVDGKPALNLSESDPENELYVGM